MIFDRGRNPFLYRLSIYGIGFLIGTLLSLKYCEMRSGANFIKRVKGEVFPEIIGRDLNSFESKLSNYNGHIIMLNFWSSVNPSCRSYNVELVALSEEVGSVLKDSLPFTVLSVNMDFNQELAKAAIKKDSLYWESHLLPDSLDMGFYGIRELPCVYLLDTNRVILAKTTNTNALRHAISLWK